MPFFSSPSDSTTLFYRYYQPDDISFRPRDSPLSKLTLVFLHGWPMSSKMFEHLLVPLCETYRIRCIAPDRRGFGNSDWNNGPKSSPITWSTFINDTVELLKYLDARDFIFVGASMGAAEGILAYARNSFVRERCRGFIFIGPSMPYPLACPESPLSSTTELWDSILQGLRDNRSDYASASLPGIFALPAGNEVGAKTLEHFERIVAEADAMAFEKTAQIILTPTDKELRQLAEGNKQVPTMILHGDSDQGSPLEASAALVKELVPWAELKVYEKAGHGLYLTHARQVIEDIVKFVDKISQD